MTGRGSLATEVWLAQRFRDSDEILYVYDFKAIVTRRTVEKGAFWIVVWYDTHIDRRER